jgi:hypothetical protein
MRDRNVGAAIAKLARWGVWALAAWLVLGFASPAHATEAPGGRVFYLSPNGSDSNPGTSAAPWKSLWQAAVSVSAGDTVILTDGVYNETRPTVFQRGGTSTQRVTVVAQNRGRAHVHYVGRLNTNRLIINKPYITVQNIDFSGEIGTNTGDILFAVRKGGDYAQVRGNWLHGVFEDALKVSEVSGVLVEYNVLYDSRHEGIDAVNVADSVFKTNRVFDVGRVGILAKGGSRRVTVSGNAVSASYKTPAGFIAIALGGITGAASTLDPKGYEGYYLVARNNTVSTTSYGKINWGVAVMGCYRCSVLTNRIVGARYGIMLRDGGDPVGSYGQQPWVAHTVAPVLSGNVILYSTVRAVYSAY